MDEVSSTGSFYLKEKQPVGHGDPLIVLEDLSKSYRDLKVLENISISVNRGDVLGLIGPNGAGKTTTIRILVGLLRDFKGRVLINGCPIPADAHKVSHMIGYLPQKVSFQRWRTVDHVLSTFGRLSGMDKQELERRILHVLEVVDLLDVRHKKIVHLSGGMVQRLGLAQAILHDPKLIILDEPLAGLDPENRFKFKKILGSLCKNGTTIIFSSHILSDVQDMVTRIMIINRGRVMFFGTINSLRDEHSLTQDIDIELANPIKDLDDLNRIQGVISTEHTKPNSILVHIDKGTDINRASNEIQRYLLDHGHAIRTFTSVVQNLEELYVSYTKGGCN